MGLIPIRFSPTLNNNDTQEALCLFHVLARSAATFRREPGSMAVYHMSFAISGDETNNYRSVGGIFFILKGIL